MPTRSVLAGLNLHAIQQYVKWTVYTILIVNFFFYILDDMEAAEHSLRDGGSFLDWSAFFATTIDESAWFILLFLFELETYALSDDTLEGGTSRLIHGVRIICYAFLAHTIYAYAGILLALEQAAPLAGVADLCQLANQGMSYTYNLAYTVVDQSNCLGLSTGTEFFPVNSDSVVTDTAGIANSRGLAWVDLVEAIVWVLIVFLIEFIVWMQNRGISSGPLISMGNLAKPALYGILLLIAAYWGVKQHWLFVWDEIIWIGGFMVIEMNVVEWREELHEEMRERGSA